MSPRPLRPCLQPTCGTLVPKGYCATHQRRREQARGSAYRRHYGPRHRKWRVLVLHRDPLCRGCEREPSRQADHVVPLKCGGTWDIENGQGLCDSCHSYKTAVEQRDPFFGLRLREAGKATGESAPSGWRKDPAFCRDAA